MITCTKTASHARSRKPKHGVFTTNFLTFKCRTTVQGSRPEIRSPQGCLKSSRQKRVAAQTKAIKVGLKEVGRSRTTKEATLMGLGNRLDGGVIEREESSLSLTCLALDAFIYSFT